MILPSTPYPTIPVVEVQPSTTYYMDPSSKRILGTVTGLDAVAQAYNKMFESERFAYEIYNADYGVEFEDLFGQDIDYVVTVLPRRIRDALFADDRTVSIPELTCTATSVDTVEVFVRVITIEGSVVLRKELTFSAR